MERRADKVTRVQHLRELSNRKAKASRFEVIACIDGRGFGVRREDMKKAAAQYPGEGLHIANHRQVCLTHSRLTGFRTK